VRDAVVEIDLSRGAVDAEALGLFLISDRNAGDFETGNGQARSGDAKSADAQVRRRAGKIENRLFIGVGGIGYAAFI